MSPIANKHRAFVAEQMEHYDELLELQGGVCAICKHPPKTRRLNLDHDHRTMTVRGLLCHRCNRALPAWVDPEWLYRAAHYLTAASNREALNPTNGSGSRE